MINWKQQFDAIDLGCAHGNTAQHARHAFGAKKILGIDRRGVHGKDARIHKFHFYKADVLDIFIPANCCKFVTMGHFLEHLPTPFCMDRILMMAWGACSDFVYANNPAWDCVPRLKRNGLKFYWQEWADHTLHVTTKMVHDNLSDMGIKHVIFAGGHASTSVDKDMHPLSSPANAGHYDSRKHPPKPLLPRLFLPKVFKEMTVFAWRDRKAWLKWRPVVERMYGKQHKVMYEEIPE